MRTPRTAAQFLIRSLVLTSALALLGAEARADDCDCTCRPSYRTSHGHTSLIRSGRSGCTPRAHGSPWSVLRRYLPSGRDEIRRLHVRNYFLRRYPFALAPDAVLETAAHVDTLLAIGSENAETPRALDAAGHLDRGMGRFFTRNYDGARTDFDAVLKTAPKDQRARWGLLLVAICKNEWKTASTELGTLAKAGELKREDRLALAGSFADASVLPNIVKGLREYAGYATGDADAHLVTAWALAYQGDTKKAKIYLRMAQRTKASHPAVKALAANLKPAAKAKAVPAKAQPEEKVVPAPKVQLHKEIAVAKAP